MGVPVRKPYTVEDYLAWTGDPIEVIDGRVYAMTPAPAPRHQAAVVNLVWAVETALRKQGRGPKNPCRVYVAPLDVQLDEWTIVQPDVCIICDPAQLREGRCQGPPRFVAEVLSPSTAFKDRQEKLRAYERHKVPEYLIIDPGDGWCLRYRLGPEGMYDAGTPVPLDGPLEVCGLELALSLREIVELEEA